MLKRKKHSTKDLSNKISELKEQNNLLNKEVSKLQLLKDRLPYIAKVFENERVDVFIANHKSGKAEILETSLKANILDHSPETLNELVNLIAVDDNFAIINAIEKLEVNNSVNFQIKIHKQTGSGKENIPAELTTIRVSNEEYLYIIKDISIFSRQKRELTKTKEKVEQHDKLKTIILSNISHQIRTPLNSITGFSELIANSNIDAAQRKDYIDIIKRQSKRILTLIDDLSEITKLESGSINISNTPCNLNLILKEIHIGLNQQRSSIRKEIVSIEIDTPKTEDFDIITDSGRLQQVLLNIANYSLRHTEKGTIRIGYIFNHDTQKVEFTISDTSEGLTKEEQKVLFDRFMIIDNSENSKLEDPGLGLTIAKETVKALGGKISVDSEPGNGVTFHFNIPLEIIDNTQPEESIDEISSEQNYHWANKVILVVDDEDVNAMFLDAVFQITGVQLIFAKNGLQALELVKNINKIDLILMDIKMPVMNGIKATKEIRKINQAIPIIAQTALASEEDRLATISAGCNNAITKPIEVAELLQLVNSYFIE